MKPEAALHRSVAQCSVDDCCGRVIARGLCGKHYSKWKKYGHPLRGSAYGIAKAFFEEKVLPHTGDNCLFWPFATTELGHAVMVVDNRRWRVARRVLVLLVGAPPTAAHHAAHSCGNGHLGCVAPRHLRWATPAENEADKLLHGTLTRGTRNGMVKLTTEQAREVRARALAGEPQPSIAAAFGISTRTVSKIKLGARWAWL